MTIAILIGGAIVLFFFYSRLPVVEDSSIFHNDDLSDRERQELLNRAIQPFYPWILLVALLAFAGILLWLVPKELHDYVLQKVRKHPLGVAGIVSGAFFFGVGLGIAFVRRSTQFVGVFDIGQRDVFLRQINGQLRFYVISVGACLVVGLAVDFEGLRIFMASLLSAAVGIAVGLCIRLSTRKKP